MNKAVPWNVNGIGFEAREAAHVAARRAGVPVGEWLNSVITEHASDIGVTPESFSADDRLDSLVARLAGVAESLGDVETRENSRASAVRNRSSAATSTGAASMSYAANEDPLLPEQDDAVSPGRQARHRMAAGASRDRGYLAEWDNDVLLDEALELIGNRSGARTDRRTEQQRMTVAALAGEAEALNGSESERVGSQGRYRQAKTGGARRERRPVRDAVGVVAERLEEIEDRIAQRDADFAARPIVAALGRLEDRFEHLLRRNLDGGREAARFETGFHELDSRLRELGERIERNEASSRTGTGPVRDAGLTSVLSRLDRAEGRGRTNEGEDAASRQRQPIRTRDVVAEIAQRQMDLDAVQLRRSGLMGGTSHSTIDQAQREPAPVRPAAPRDDLAGMDEFGPFSALQDAFAKLTERLEARLDAQARASSFDERGADISALKSGIAELGERLDTIRSRDEQERAEREDRQPFDLLRQEITALQRGLATLAPQSAIETLETAVRELGGQLDASRRTGVSSSVLAPIEAIQEDIRAALQDDSLRTKVGQVETQLQAIVGRIESMDAYGPGAEAIQALNDQTRDIHELLGSAAAQFQTVERLETEIGRLGGRVERLIEGPPRGAVRDLELAVNEIRTLLVQFSPETVMHDVSRQLDGFANRIGSLEEAVSAPAAMLDDFGRRIDDAHAALADRLLRAAPAVDLTPIEEKLGVLAGKVDGIRGSSADMQALGGLVRGLAAQIEEARLPSADAKIIETLETQVGRLAERLDRSDASLDAIGSVERLIRELFNQIDDTRSSTIEAAENAARSAAKETLRAALVSPTIAGEEASARASRVVEQVGQEISEFRKAQQVSEKRVHSTLIALNETLERMVDRMVVEAGVPVEGGPKAEPAAATDRKLPSSPAPAQRAPDPAEVASTPAVAVSLPPVAMAVDAGREPVPVPVRVVAPTVEVGRGPASEPMPDVSPLIAAARRAAQAAQVSAAGKEGGPKAKSLETRPEAAKGWRTVFSQKRRPMLLSIASVVLLLGALQIVRLAQSERHGLKADKTQVVAQQPADGLLAGTDAPAASAAAPVQTAKADLTFQPQTASPTVSAFVQPAPKALSVGLRDLADRGDAAAQYEVGARLAEGRGLTRDAEAAAGWFERSAKQSFAPAEYRLGSLYEKGIGVTAAPAQAVTWYEKAANQGNVRAMHNLAVMAAEGSAGKADYARAATWFSKAAEHGVRDSQYNLAILYARGLGLTQDLGQSYTWFSIAAAQGDTDAGKKREDVAAKLDAAKLTVAKAAADTFKPLPTDKAANEVAPPPGGWDVAASLKSVPASPKLSSM